MRNPNKYTIIQNCHNNIITTYCNITRSTIIWPTLATPACLIGTPESPRQGHIICGTRKLPVSRLSVSEPVVHFWERRKDAATLPVWMKVTLSGGGPEVSQISDPTWRTASSRSISRLKHGRSGWSMWTFLRTQDSILGPTLWNVFFMLTKK